MVDLRCFTEEDFMHLLSCEQLEFNLVSIFYVSDF